MKISINPPVLIKSSGRSPWGDTSGAEPKIDAFEIDPVCTEGEQVLTSLTVFGSGMPWQVYPQRTVLEQIKEVLAPYFVERGIVPVYFDWSEQGLQADNEWNFDLHFEKRQALTPAIR